MNRPLLLSVGAHIAILAALLVFGYAEKPEAPVLRTVRVRLSESSIANAVRGAAGPVKPNEASRERPGSRRLPAFDKAVVEESPAASLRRNPVVAVAEQTRAVAPPVGSESFLDPLAGMEDYLPEKTGDGGDFIEKWSVSWEDGRDRGILSSLAMDTDTFPEKMERLMSVSVGIAVSPRGEVLSAEIVEPGSGDVRIDRYLVAWALSLAFEPIPSDDLIQNGVFRLVFADGAP